MSYIPNHMFDDVSAAVRLRAEEVPTSEIDALPGFAEAIADINARIAVAQEAVDCGAGAHYVAMLDTAKTARSDMYARRSIGVAKKELFRHPRDIEAESMAAWEESRAAERAAAPTPTHCDDQREAIAAIDFMRQLRGGQA